MSVDHKIARPQLDRRTQLFYGVGAVAFGIKDQGFLAFLLLFYNQVMGLPAALVSTGVMIALVIDAVLDPIIGQVSDTWHSRWGRRHPFMYAAAAPSAIAYLLLWNPPADWSQGALLAYLVVVTIVVRSFITVFEIPNAALLPELTTDYDRRTTVMSYRYFFYFWGGLGLNLLTFYFLLQPTEQQPVGQLNPQGYHRYGWMSAVVILISILASAAGTHRLIPFLSKPAAAERRTIGSIAREMAATLSNQSFLMILVSSQLKSMVVGISRALKIYIDTYFWQLSATKISILLLDSLLSSALASALVPRLSQRFGKKNAAMGLLAASYFVGMGPIVLRLLGLFWANDSPWLVPTLFANGILLGVTGIGATIVTASMIADVTEDSQRRTGRRSEGLLFSAMTMMQKAISGFGVFGAGLILSAIGFPRQAEPGEVDDHVLRSLMYLYLPTLAVLYFIALACMAAYRIDRSKHEENVRTLDEREVQFAGADAQQGHSESLATDALETTRP